VTGTRLPSPSIADLEARLGYAFARGDLLATALTHVSASNVRKRIESYQRLEFLGDRVLGLVVSEMLYEHFPTEEEGELSRRLSQLVRKETCAEVARAWDIGPFLKLGAGEAKGGGRKRTPILGDACEAIIGAVFLDGGFDAARNLVRRSFGERMDEVAGTARDAKTALQEWAQGRGKRPPVYREISRGGPDHKPVFVIGVEVEGYEICEAEGASKRIAEQSAAQAFMEREHVPTISNRRQPQPAS
jgi:ribonuclease-3